VQDTAEREHVQDTAEREHVQDTAEREPEQERPGGTGGAPASKDAVERGRRGPERTRHGEENSTVDVVYRCVQLPSGGLTCDG
jgi:hypothetical protein